MPFAAQLGQRLRRLLVGDVVVNDVAGADEKVRLQLGHGLEHGEAELLVFLRRGHGAAAVRLAGHEGVVVHAAAHAEGHVTGLPEGFKTTDRTRFRFLPALAEDEAVVVSGAGIELFDVCPHDEIAIRIRFVPFAAGGFSEVG